MTEMNFIHTEGKPMPGFKVFKDRMTILLGSKGRGYTVEPFVTWHSEKPRAFEHINKHTLARVLQEQ